MPVIATPTDWAEDGTLTLSGSILFDRTLLVVTDNGSGDTTVDDGVSVLFADPDRPNTIIATSLTADTVDLSKFQLDIAVNDGFDDNMTFTGSTALRNILSGGSGNDTLTGGGQADLLDGGGNDDLLIGRDGDDSLIGRDGNDALAGGAGLDRLSGGAGDDLIDGEANDDDILYLIGEGSDTVFGGAGNDVIRIFGTSLNDTLTVVANGGILTNIEGGSVTGVENVRADVFGGADLLSYGITTQDITVNLSTSAATGFNGIPGFNAISGFENVTGGSGNDALTGDAQANSLNGGGGNDTLNGGAGIDSLGGGAGNDWFFVDNAGDTANDGVGEGTLDRVFASVSYTLAAGAEIEIVSTTSHAGTAAINLAGNAFAQTLFGNAGNNILDGRGGADAMVGRAGDDWFYVDNAGDTVNDAVGEGAADRVFTSANYALNGGAQIEIVSTTNHAGTGAINLSGNEFGQTIYGNAGKNILDGRGGADIMVGQAGDDWFFVDNAGDVVNEQAGGGTADRVFASVSYALGAAANVETLSTTTTGGTTAINLTGNALAQTIYGNNGANVLNGGVGNDTLQGFAGADVYLFNTALNAATNVDAIAGYNISQNVIHLENAIFTGLAAGALAAGAFRIGAAAADADDRIIYNSATGALTFDSNGNAAGGSTQFATLAPGLAIAATEFFVV